MKTKLCFHWSFRCISSWLLSMIMLILVGCGAQIHENHYFATFSDPSSGESERKPIQFYRISVDGEAAFTNARYLTGYFDERAVALFFNEIQGTKEAKLFDNPTQSGVLDTNITALNPNANDGVFLLILSTNADAIAGTIGSFAESQVVADSLTRVLNRDHYIAKKKSDAMVSIKKAEATALDKYIEAELKVATETQEGQLAADAYKRVLNFLAQSIGYSGTEFTSFDDAKRWFRFEAPNKEIPSVPM